MTFTMTFRAAPAVAAMQRVRCGLKPARAACTAASAVRSELGSSSRLYTSEPATNPAAAAETLSEPAVEGDALSPHYGPCSLSYEPKMPTTILDRIKEDVKKSMKARDRARVSVLKGILNDITYAEKSRVPPKKLDSDEDVVNLIHKSISKRDDSIAMFRAGSREDLAANEEAEVAVLREFLPPQLTIKEIEDIVLRTCLDTAAADIKEFNRVMKAVPISFAQAPRAVVAATARRYLTVPEKYGLC